MSPPGRPKGEYRSAEREGVSFRATIEARALSKTYVSARTGEGLPELRAALFAQASAPAEAHAS